MAHTLASAPGYIPMARAEDGGEMSVRILEFRVLLRI